MESFTVAVPLHSDRGEFLRRGDEAGRPRAAVAVWTNTRLERKCIAGRLFVLWVLIVDYGLQSSVYVNLTPWTGYLPLV